jgi:hypothetical protein
MLLDEQQQHRGKTTGRRFGQPIVRRNLNRRVAKLIQERREMEHLARGGKGHKADGGSSHSALRATRRPPFTLAAVMHANRRWLTRQQADPLVGGDAVHAHIHVRTRLEGG